MPCASFHHIHVADKIIIIIITTKKYYELLASFFSSISRFRFRRHQQIRCVGLPCGIFLELFILKTSLFWFFCSSRCNPSWWTYYHAETPLHWVVRNRTPIALVGRTFWNILLVDWSIKFIDPQSCFLTRTRCREWLYSPGNRMRSWGRGETIEFAWKLFFCLLLL